MGAWRNNGNDIAVVEEKGRTFYIRCFSRSYWYFRDQTLICSLFIIFCIGTPIVSLTDETVLSIALAPSG